MSVLEAQAIAVARGGRAILDGVTLALQPGELLAIVGPNGCGKSTLLRALAGIWPVAQGSVLLDGNAIGGYSRRQIARRVALLPQSTRTDLAFTVEELVAMGRYPHRGRFAAEGAADRRAIQAAMECCDVVGLRDRFVNTLSGGEQQRVLIARSLAVEPACILLDEPTSSLDVAHSIEVLELCRTLTSAGRSVALATHDINAVSRYASTVALIQEGRLVHYGPRDQILQPSVLEQVFGVRAEMLAAAGGEPVYIFHPIVHPRRPVT